MASQPSREDPAILLGVLSAVERDSEITQRSISSELGIALGLANAYVGRCVRKGLIKVMQAPLNRYAYYLTPKGFTEKSRLTAEYLAISFNFFRDARRQCAELFAACAGCSLRRLALVGDGDLAEVAVLSAGEVEVEVVCVIDPASPRHHCASRPVVSDLAAAQALCQNPGGLDALVVTDMNTPQATYDMAAALVVRADLGDGRVFAPGLLRIRGNSGAALISESTR